MMQETEMTFKFSIGVKMKIWILKILLEKSEAWTEP